VRLLNLLGFTLGFTRGSKGLLGLVDCTRVVKGYWGWKNLLGLLGVIRFSIIYWVVRCY
jgi:hypothetical protein